MKEVLTTVEMIEREGEEPKVTIASPHTTAEVFDKLIRVFSRERASVQPPVPLTKPASVMTAASTEMKVTLNSPEGAILNLRHPGLGWVGYQLSAEQRKDLAQKFSAG